MEKNQIQPGGLCSIKYIRWEDVQTWPREDPNTGIISTILELKPGTVINFCKPAETDRLFLEEQKTSPAGDYMDIQVTAKMGGNSVAHILASKAMMFHQYVLLAPDRYGITRLIGNADSGAEFSHSHTTGDIKGSSMRALKCTWQHPVPAPVYQGTNMNIVIGNIPVKVGNITFVARFRVGAPGSPMNDGDTLFNSPMLQNRLALVLASSLALPVDDLTGQIDFTNSIERHIQKTLAGSTIKFIGGVVHNEIIEIYAFN